MPMEREIEPRAGRLRALARLAAPSLLAAAAAAVAWAATWGSLAHFVRQMDTGRYLFDDFVLRFYPVARDFLANRVPYPGFYYSPTFAVLIAPFGALPPARAAFAWGTVQVASSIGLLLVPAGWLARRSRWLLAAYVLVFLTSLPLLHNLKWGQVSVPLTLCVLGALFLFRRGHTLASAALLALAVAVKLYPAVYLAWFAVRRDVRYLGAFAVSLAVFALAVPAAVLGPRDTLGFYRGAAANLRTDEGKIAAGVNSQYLPHVVERWTHLARGSSAPLRGTGSPLRTALQLAAGALFALQLVTLLRRRRQADPIRAFAVLSASLPLLVPTSWPHYLVFLPFFQAWAGWNVLRAPRRRLAGALLVAGSVLASSLLALVLVGAWRTYTYAGLPLLAALLLLAAAHTVRDAAA